MNQANEILGSNILMGNEDKLDITDDEMLTTFQNQEEKPDEDGDHGIKFKDWGFKIDRLFEVAYKFYKRTEGKAFHPSYDERNQMNALILQARYGNFDSGRKTSDVGTLDLVGKNRRYQWSLLKGMSKAEAMSHFVCTLDRISPHFKAYAEAVKIITGTQLDRESRACIQGNGQSGAGSRSESDEQLKATHKSLCRQTYNQFKSYAEKQFPNEPSKQKTMIVALQEQYYQQYISQLQSSELNNNHQTNINNGTYKSASTSPEPFESSGALPRSMQGGNENSSSTTENMKPTSSQTASENSNIIEPQLTNERIVMSTASNATNQDPSVESIKGVNLVQFGSSAPTQSLTDRYQQQQYSSNIDPNNQFIRSCDSYVPEYQQHPTSAHPETISELHELEKDIHPIQSVGSDLSHQDYNGGALAGENFTHIGTFESYPEPKTMQKSISGYPNMAETSSKSLFNNGQEQPQATSLYTNTCSSNLSPSSQSQLESPMTLYYQSLAPPIQSDSTYHHYEQPLTEFSAADNHPLADYQQHAIEPWSCRSSTSDGGSSPLQQSISYEPLEAATIWTKKGINEFKDSLVDDKHGGAYVVKQGTLLTIQVPTYPDGKFIYWEFATDDFDIGFGLDFIHDLNLIGPLALKICEEIDEDEDEDDVNDIDELALDDLNYDIESATEGDKLNGTSRRNALEMKRAEKLVRMANTISIVPTYRRDSHEEVFVGRHRYPGKGYYLLKFDNTYSVLRSKSLFFRICYFI